MVQVVSGECVLAEDGSKGDEVSPVSQVGARPLAGNG